MRRLLIITKEPEFDVRGEVVLGQCEPFTAGWSLILIYGQNIRETLATGTYSDLRKIQEDCRVLDEPAAVRERVVLLRTQLAALAAAGKPGSRNGSNDFGTDEVPCVPGHTPGGLLNLESTHEMLVATIARPERADEPAFLKEELLTVLRCQPKAVIMDLGGVGELSSRAFKELAGVRDRLRECGAAFALCNLPRAMQRKLKRVKVKGRLPVYDSQALALAALRE